MTASRPEGVKKLEERAKAIVGVWPMTNEEMYLDVVSAIADLCVEYARERDSFWDELHGHEKCVAKSDCDAARAQDQEFWRKECDDLRAQLQTLRGERDEDRKRIYELGAQLDAVDQEKAALEARIKDQREEIDASHTLVRINKACLESAEKECDELKVAIASLEARERALREDRDKYRLHVADSVGSCCDVAGGDGGCIHDVARAALAPRRG